MEKSLAWNGTWDGVSHNSFSHYAINGGGEVWVKGSNKEII